MRRSILVLATIIMVLARSTGALGADIKVTLRAESKVQPACPVTIRDLADIKAPKAIAKRIGDMVVSTGPLPGTRRSVDLSYIKRILGAAELDDDVKISGPAKISLIGKCVKISSQELLEQAKSFVLSRLENDNWTYDVIADRMPHDVIAPYGIDVQIKPRLMSSCVRIGCNTVALDIVIDGKLIFTTSTALQIKAVGDVLVAKTSIRQGEALTSENTSWEKRDISRSSEVILADQNADVQSLVAGRTIRQGCTISVSDVTQPAIVRKGDSVSLIVKCGEVMLHVSAEAKQSGKVGDTIPVRSALSEQDVRAKITEPGIVEITR